MPDQRFGLHFTDELPGDAALWRDWLTRLPGPVKAAAEMGQRRPLIAVAAPFKALGSLTTKRSDEVAGLAIARALVAELARLAVSSGRSIQVLLGGRPIGLVDPAGAAAAITAKLDEWQALVDAREPDEIEWAREGYVSLWAGVLPYADVEKLLAERYGTDGPISGFARALRIGFYDHDFIEHDATEDPVELATAIGRLSFSASFVDHLPPAARQTRVNTVIALFDTDFSQRPRDAARGRLRFVGAFPYDGEAPPLIVASPGRRRRR